VFSARLEVRDGRVGEATAGLNQMTGGLLEEGTTKRGGAEVSAAIGAVGGSYSADGGGVAAKTLSKDAKLALEVMSEVAQSPRFDEKDVEKVRGQQLQAIARELDTPRAVAQAKFNSLVYGESHPLGRSGLGTVDAVKRIGRDDVAAHHAKFWVPRNSVLAMVSDRDPAEMVALAKEAFGGWKDVPAPQVDLPATPAAAAKSVHVDMAREQTNQFIGHLGVVRTHPDYVPLEVMDNVLGTGAGFTDRLSMNVRDVKGLAYSVFGNMTSNSARWPGTLRLYAGTNPKDAASARTEMRRELQGIIDRPPTEEELAGAKSALRGGMINRCETASDVVGVLLLCERFQLGFDYPRRYLTLVEAVTAADVTRVAKAHVRPDALVEVVVGPQEPK
jgi:zinc protease